MYKHFLLFSSFLCISFISQAQLYSSGNTVISGTNVGVGTSTPAVKLHIKNTTAGELLRMENTNASGFGKFSLYNDVAGNYANFTKYGSTFAGGYPGIATMYPYANLLAFGNNGGACLLTTGGNIGISIYKSGTSKLKFNVNYVSENLGLGGNADPKSNVHINGALTGDTLKITNATSGHTLTDGLDIRTTGLLASIINRENSSLELGTNNTSHMKISADGKISMGNVTLPSGYKLYVEHGILTEKVKVAVKSSSEWSDYVFADDYQLTNLTTVEAYIKSHKHLPGVPSADEVVEQGIDMAKMDATLLQKIEELTLHMIEMNKRIEYLEKENASLLNKNGH